MGIEYAILSLGQSNAEPTAPLSEYLALIPEMNFSTLTPDPLLGVYYGYAIETIRFLTFYNPPSLPGTLPAGPAPAPFASYDYSSYCKWLPWTVLEGTNTAVPRLSNQAPVGFKYPNHFCVPHGPIYDDFAGVVIPSYPGTVNSVVDLARRMQGWLKKRVNVIQCAVASTSLQQQETNALYASFGKWGWFDGRLHTNWSPSDQDALAARLVKVLTAAKIATEAEGNTLKIILVTMKQGETDAISTYMREMWGTNCPAFIDWVRSLIYSLGIAIASEAQTPFVWAKITDHPWGSSNAAVINAVLDSRQADDPYFATYDTNSFQKLTTNDPHYGTLGIISLANADFAALLAIRARTSISLPMDNVPTLAELRAQVRRVTERNTADTGQSDEVITEAINEAYLDLINYVADTCWWLRQINRITLVSNPLTPVALPRVVTRLLEIRPATAPWTTYDWSMVGHADGGRVQIITLNYVQELVDLHHMYVPNKMMADDEKPLIPAEYIEAVKIAAARRVTVSAGNATLESKLRVEEARLLGLVSIHANKVDRQRRQRLNGGRRRMGNNGFLGQFGNPFYPWQN